MNKETLRALALLLKVELEERIPRKKINVYSDIDILTENHHISVKIGDNHDGFLQLDHPNDCSFTYYKDMNDDEGLFIGFNANKVSLFNMIEMAHQKYIDRPSNTSAAHAIKDVVKTN